MSAQKAFPAPDFSYPIPPVQPQADRPRRRRLWLIVPPLFVISLIMSGAILVFCPTVLEAMSAVFLKPQVEAIPWNGHDRITVLAMGLTQRTTEPARTDTLMLMDIDPANRRVNVLSVPRDLWVNIPGYGQGKLAIAYAEPGGGSRLAAYTIEHELGIPVDYTISLKFSGFTKIVDAMGGVTVNVPQELNDPTYPCLRTTAYCPIDIKPGKQHMNGATALEFVRERHAFAQQDLARVKDQQAFADALKHTALSPLTVLRYPAMLNALKQNLITNLPLNDLPAVGLQYVLPLNHVNHAYINEQNGMVQPGLSADGQSILTPTSSTAIPALVRSLFYDSVLTQENASVAVLNGTATGGAAGDVAATLQKLGFHTVATGNAANSNYAHSQVVVNTAFSGNADYTARRLQRLMNAQLVHQSLPSESAKIVLIIGNDAPA